MNKGNEEWSKTLSKAKRFHIHSSFRRRECDVSERNCEPARARLQLRAHWSGTLYLRPPARQPHSALSLLTSNTHTPTHTPFTVRSFKQLMAVIEETDSGFHIGQNSWCQHASWWRYRSKWGIHFPDVAVTTVQRRRLKASKLCSLYFTSSEIFASFISHQSQGKGSGIANFNYPP